MRGDVTGRANPGRVGRRSNRPWSAVVVALGVLSAAGADNPPPDEVVEQEADLGGAMRAFEVAPQQFDMWVFGTSNRVMPTGVSTFDPRDRLETSLAMKVDEIAAACKLTPAQRRKLVLAGHGDIQRFVEEVDSKRAEFELVRKDQQRFGNFYQTLQPLRTRFQGGLFNEGSFFAKSVSRALEPEQAEQFAASLRERAAYRYEACVDLLVVKLGQGTGLTTDQRRRLRDVILAETKPPKSMGTQEFNAAFYQASKIPLERFREVLDPSQLQVLGRQFERMTRWEMSLKMSGYVPADATPEPAGPKASAARETKRP
jgi:hypothetical protein